MLAVDAHTGLVYEPDLQTMIEGSQDNRCSFRVVDAGFRASSNVDILVRAHFSIDIEEGETETVIPAARSCGSADQTWSFNFATGEVEQVPNTEPLRLFKKSLRHR